MNKVKLEYYISKEKKSLISGPFGSNISSKFFVSSGIPVIRGNNLTYGDRKFIDSGFVFVSEEKADELGCDAIKNDIIITAAGTIGQIGLITNDLKYNRYVISNKQIRLRLDNSVCDVKFIYLLLNSEIVRQQIINNNTGSTIPLINLSVVRNILIPEFDLPTQQKIASVLSALDDKIELNNRINAELEAMAKTLYDYWFVQFDFPNAKDKPYKTSGGKMVYNETLKREIPEGWEVKKLEELGNFKNGVNYNPSNPGNIPCPIINVRNISGSSYFIKNEDLDIIYLNENDVKKYSVNENSIIVARSGIPGATRLISDFSENTLYCGFAIHYEIYNPLFKNKVFFYLKSLEELIKNGSGGTIMKNVNQQLLNNLIISIPEKSILSAFNRKIDIIFKKINNLEKQNQELSALRDWLLPMLMNGQVKVG